ncbi:MAG: hypothetical protein LHV68_10770 [Elusimicrobia bacterium]|nr:hypothetical protein [Candidatus Liberimonas magnetica]
MLTKTFSYPFPQARISPIEQFVVLDLTGVIGGFRRLAADIAWIQLLVYYGEPKVKVDEETKYKLSWDYLKYLLGLKSEAGEEHHGNLKAAAGKVHSEGEEEAQEFNETKKLVVIDKVNTFPELYSYCRRVIFLDPFFDYAYLYGAGALAWNQERPNEAVDLLNYGIDRMELYSKDITRDSHQPFWQFHLYLGAIIYRNEGNFQKMTESLEVAVTQKNCPNMVRAILASIYSKDKKYAKALKLWLDIYDTNDQTYQKRSLEEIYKLKKLLNI